MGKVRIGLSLLAVCLLSVVVPGAVASPAQADPGGEVGVERYLNSVRHDPARLRSFLLGLPKGGDLHSHLSGAASTELLISLAAQDGMCIDTTTFVAAGGPCGAGQRPATDTSTDPAFYRAVLMSWSMEGFQPGQGESGHDHFFATFGKFGAVTGAHRVELLADVLDRAGRQNEQYMESMLTRQGGALFDLSQACHVHRGLRRDAGTGAGRRHHGRHRRHRRHGDHHRRGPLPHAAGLRNPGGIAGMRGDPALHPAGQPQQSTQRGVHVHGVGLRTGRGRPPHGRAQPGLAGGRRGVHSGLSATHADAGVPAWCLPHRAHHPARRRTRSRAGQAGGADLPHPRGRAHRSGGADRARHRRTRRGRLAGPDAHDGRPARDGGGQPHQQRADPRGLRPGPPVPGLPRVPGAGHAVHRRRGRLPDRPHPRVPARDHRLPPALPRPENPGPHQPGARLPRRRVTVARARAGSGRPHRAPGTGWAHPAPAPVARRCSTAVRKRACNGGRKPSSPRSNTVTG